MQMVDSLLTYYYKTVNCNALSTMLIYAYWMGIFCSTLKTASDVVLLHSRRENSLLSINTVDIGFISLQNIP